MPSPPGSSAANTGPTGDQHFGGDRTLTESFKHIDQSVSNGRKLRNSAANCKANKLCNNTHPQDGRPLGEFRPQVAWPRIGAVPHKHHHASRHHSGKQNMMNTQLVQRTASEGLRGG